MSRAITAQDGAADLARGPGHRHAPLGRPLPGRQRPIRVTLTVLLAIPVIALVALWAYAAFTTIGPYIAQRNGNTETRLLAAPSTVFLQQLTEERADTLAWQAEHGPRDALSAQRARTDAAVSALETGLAGTRGIGGAAAASAAGDLVQQIGQLTHVRAGIDAGRIGPLAAFADYNTIADVYFQYIRTQLVSNSSVDVYQQGEAVIDSGQALEMIGREAAVVGGALAGGGTMTVAEYRQFVQALDQQRFLVQTINSPGAWRLTPNPFKGFYASRSYQQFAALEDRIADAGAGARVPVSPAVWQAEVQSTLKSYGGTELAAAEGISGISAHLGHVILLRLVLVGGAGLAAVLIVAFLMARFGNRITQELTTFNGTVRSVAEERLPSIMRRLSDGQDVDVETEAPPIDLDSRTLEVARIADGFSAVQRTAVAAAVGQAGLRKGISNIFRSLARRNQSLLQRQLRMLEEMEQGTEDPDMLAQLFRLDHLTTRMRRQSEGLIILSGAASGPPLEQAGAGHRGAARRHRRDRRLRPRRPGGRDRRPGGRDRRGRPDPPAGRADRERHHVLAAEHPGPGQDRLGGQRLHRGDRRPRPGHPRRHHGRAEPAAGPAARVRPGRQRPARPAGGQPPGPAARHPGHAA